MTPGFTIVKPGMITFGVNVLLQRKGKKSGGHSEKYGLEMDEYVAEASRSCNLGIYE